VLPYAVSGASILLTLLLNIPFAKEALQLLREMK
jgi:hypothetical protein